MGDIRRRPGDIRVSSPDRVARRAAEKGVAFIHDLANGGSELKGTIGTEGSGSIRERSLVSFRPFGISHVVPGSRGGLEVDVWQILSAKPDVWADLVSAEVYLAGLPPDSQETTGSVQNKLWRSGDLFIIPRDGIVSERGESRGGLAMYNLGRIANFSLFTGTVSRRVW